ncbi:sensor histidine kinase [Caulobacter mirabilis]|uniref:sensor histidine kinase n=1 Tax=Caulobacter mirabilis TaxID=69666 RepID=UPI0015591095|nr:sensor histidine kinase [Caulobacter mirabilis]
MRRSPPSLVLRLLVAQIIPLALLAAALAAGGAIVAHRIVERTSDRLLAGSVSAIVEQIGAENGQATVSIPPWSLGLLDGPERDAVFYSVRQGDRLVTGYSDLQAAAPPPPNEMRFRDGRIREMPIRIAETTVDVPGVADPIVVVVAQTLDSRRAGVLELLSGLIALPVLLVGGAALLIWPAVLWSLRPLDRLVRRLTDQSAGRRADYAPADLSRVPVEIAPVVRAYNGLLASLERSASALERFAPDASHQLRTPLSVITANLALLAGRSGSRDESAALIQDSRDASARLNLMLKQLLALARAETAAASGQADLQEVVDQVVLDTARNHRHARLHRRLPASALTVRGDPVLLVELLNNLVSNAVNYGGGEVFLWAPPVGTDITVLVWDRGPGIAEADLAHLAERFYRGDQARGADGAGLGLAIVHAISDAFGIAIEVQNRRRRKGLVVRLRFSPAHIRGTQATGSPPLAQI